MRDNIHDMKTQEELIKLKESTGMNWKKFSASYGIPYRTVQDWYMGKRRMPDYLLRLMVYKFEMEKMISPDEFN
jgi:DNA-binding transcriptional regulator YiaG